MLIVADLQARSRYMAAVARAPVALGDGRR